MSGLDHQAQADNEAEGSHDRGGYRVLDHAEFQTLRLRRRLPDEAMERVRQLLPEVRSTGRANRIGDQHEGGTDLAERPPDDPDSPEPPRS